MDKLYGFTTPTDYGTTQYRFKVRVPTSIYEPKLAVITAYRGRGHGKKVREIRVCLEDMPYISRAQALRLRRADDTKVRRCVDRLVAKLTKTS